MHTRLSWDSYFLGILEAVSARATCDRGRCGCIITLDNRILTTGYAGAPSGMPSCDEEGHIIKYTIEGEEPKQHCVRTIHAEQNAIAIAAKHGVSLKGATLYCTMHPCLSCAMLIVAAGINRVVSQHSYPSQEEQSSKVLQDANILTESCYTALHKRSSK